MSDTEILYLHVIQDVQVFLSSVQNIFPLKLSFVYITAFKKVIRLQITLLSSYFQVYFTFQVIKPKKYTTKRNS